MRERFFTRGARGDELGHDGRGGDGYYGFDPMTPGYAGPPFETCENTMQLVEAKGLGTRDLKRIEVRGVPIEKALFRMRQA